MLWGKTHPMDHVLLGALLCCFTSAGATSVVVDGILVQELNNKSLLHGHSHTCSLQAEQQAPLWYRRQSFLLLASKDNKDIESIGSH